MKRTSNPFSSLPAIVFSRRALLSFLFMRETEVGAILFSFFLCGVRGMLLRSEEQTQRLN